MNSIIHFNECPICRSPEIQASLNAKDYTVSLENFEIWQCKNCTARFTQNIPGKNQIGKYYQSGNYVSHSETRKGLINKLYHFVRNYTLGQKLRMIQKVTNLSKGHLLDVGAGTGAFAASMQKSGWHITGLEPDKTARENARKNHDIALLEPDNLFSLPEESYDVITLWHVLEHVHQLHEYLDTFYKILKPGGKLIIAVPNFTGDDSAHYQQYWAAYDVPRHLYHFSPQSMRQLMKKHLFSITNYKPMWFDSFYVCMLSEEYKTGRKNLIKAFIRGLQSNIRAIQHNELCSSVIYIMEK